jgi:DNA-binding NarL/FixJ family response regulator
MMPSPDERPIIGAGVVDGPGFPCVGAVPAEPVLNGALSRADCDHEPGIALIDAFPLRRASTLQLLRAHFREGAQQFASATEFLTNASTGADTPSVVVVCVGRRSVADAPLLERLQLIRRALPTLPMIVLSDREEVEEVVAAFREGVQGYIPTSLAPRLVAHAIRIVLAGGTFYPADALIRARLLIRPEIKRAPDLAQVTAEHREQWPPRQLAVLCLLTQSKPNKQIAQMLMIEEGTVKVHIRQIMRKLGVANRTQAALAARRLGIAACNDTPVTVASSPNTAPTRPAWFDDPHAASRLNRLANIDSNVFPADLASVVQGGEARGALNG